MKTRRTKDLASSQLQSCFCGDDLLRYRSGGLSNELRSQIFYHLNVEKCQRCKDLFLTVQGPPQEASPEKPNRRMIDRLKRETGIFRARPVPMRLEKGQIWTTSPEPRDGRGNVAGTAPMAVPVLLVSPGTGDRSLQNRIRVLPISNDVGFHLQGETLIIHEDSPLGYPFLVEIFNESPMLAGNLGEYRGSVSESRSREIQALRETYVDGAPALKPDRPYLKWRQQEIETARYLSLPVNEAIWAEPVESGIGISEADVLQGTDVDIDLVPYKKAADADGVDLSGITPHLLMDQDAFTLAIVQRENQVLLRFISNSITPDICIDHEPATMERKGEGLLETVLGYSPSIPESMSITAIIEGETFVFSLTFRGSYET